ncbi:MAG: glutamate racemase [Pseudomonadota bacterium]|nr:glutamate racemase [Pseudomonadota bacterium]MEC8977473.1 glutamate racemase [Pseudomonadota bacterium]
MNQSIGVYDSGVGGYTVLNVLRKRFPNENWVYLQDKDNMPYGNRTQEEIIALGNKCLSTLASHDVKACVVACHTSSAIALPSLAKNYDFPIIGMLKPTVNGLLTQPDKPILWLATQASVRANRLHLEMQASGYVSAFRAVSCVGWVEQIEKSCRGSRVKKMVLNTLLPHWAWIRENRPRIVYGCTHYPWLQPILSELLGDALYIDPAVWVADALAEMLTQYRLHTCSSLQGRVVTIPPDYAVQVAS